MGIVDSQKDEEKSEFLKIVFYEEYDALEALTVFSAGQVDGRLQELEKPGVEILRVFEIAAATLPESVVKVFRALEALDVAANEPFMAEGIGWLVAQLAVEFQVDFSEDRIPPGPSIDYTEAASEEGLAELSSEEPS